MSKTVHVNLNSKRLHDLRMKRREEIRQQAQAASDMMPSRFSISFEDYWEDEDFDWPLEDGYNDWD